MALSAFGIGVKVSHTLPDLLRPLYLDRRSRPATLWGRQPGTRRPMAVGIVQGNGVVATPPPLAFSSLDLGDRLTRGFFTVARW